MNLLVTGALGYIGSHASMELANEGHNLVLLDNLSNSSLDVLDNLEKIVSKKLIFENMDIRETKNLKRILKDYNIDAVVHFAGLKSVRESLIKNAEYYDVNVMGSNSLFEAMEEVMEKKILIFSSSACVYGDPNYLPIDEDHNLDPLNPYGLNKLEIENSLKKLYESKKNWCVVCLRYFNPIGSEESFLLGENPHKGSENLMPSLTKVAARKEKFLKVFGNDYETKDGTGVRDYIHVMDLVDGHIKALEILDEKENFFDFINLGTGKGFTVLEIINSFEKVNKVKIRYKFFPRRKGDAQSSYANFSKAKKILSWEPKRKLDEMCRTSWGYQKRILHI